LGLAKLAKKRAKKISVVGFLALSVAERKLKKEIVRHN
jgi:hypothetical protein